MRIKDISKEDFKTYLEVQKSGVTNMFNLNAVSVLSGLDRDTIKGIMIHYNKLKEVYKC